MIRPTDPVNPNSQKTPYLEGRNNIKVYTAIPHKTDPENNGTILNAQYGDGPDITQIEGQVMEDIISSWLMNLLTTIIANGIDDSPTYMGRNAPIDVMIYDPIGFQTLSLRSLCMTHL